MGFEKWILIRISPIRLGSADITFSTSAVVPSMSIPSRRATIPMIVIMQDAKAVATKSVGENVQVNLLCEDDNETYVPVEIPLEQIKVKHTKGHKNVIKLTKNIFVNMR